MALTQSLLAIFTILIVVNSEVIPFDNKAIEKIFQ